MRADGIITSITSSIAQVTFTLPAPAIHDVLVHFNHPDIKLEVVAFESDCVCLCYILNNSSTLQLGDQVVNTHEQLMIPVGRSVLGRAFNVFGEPQDNKPLHPRKLRSIHESTAPDTAHTIIPHQTLHTGIKAVDFFAPILEGGKMGLIGGAGLGKTMLLTELIHNVVMNKKKRHEDTDETKVADKETREVVSVFGAVGERSREAQELLENVTEAGVIDTTVAIIGQMGENPSIRFRTASAAATVAEEFRDQGTDVLFFIDNMYRFSQAGYELATLTKAIPSEDGYQPTIPSEIGVLHERLRSSSKASITTIEAVYLPSDDLADYSVRTVMSYLDSYIVLSRDVYQSGRLPAIDLLRSQSSAISVEVIGKTHYHLHKRAVQLLEEANKLERIVSLVGEAELSKESQILYRRAQLLKNYMTQNFTVAESQSGHKGAQIPLGRVLREVAAILDGQADGLKPEELLNVEKLPI